MKVFQKNEEDKSKKMPTFQELRVPEAAPPERLDVYLSQGKLPLSRSQIKQLILGQHIQVNSRPVRPCHKLHPGEVIQITIPDPQPALLLPQALPLDIVYEDEVLVVVNKSPGIVVHPGVGNPSGTLVNALLAHCGTLASGGAPCRPGIVHRLDKDTSGLLVVVKTDAAYLKLTSLIARREHRRIYWGLACGEIPQGRGEISVPIGRHVVDRKKFSPITRKDHGPGGSRSRGREAKTSFRVLERFPGLTLVELKPYTGRTHQLRVHMKYLGYSLFGDRTYGGKTSLTLKKAGRGSHSPPSHGATSYGAELKLNLTSQALHAKTLGFVHPQTGKYLEFEAPLPPDMQEILNKLREFVTAP